MRGVPAFLTLLTAMVAAAKVEIVERPMILYSQVSPKLRIQTKSPAFAGEETGRISSPMNGF